MNATPGPVFTRLDGDAAAPPDSVTPGALADAAARIVDAVREAARFQR